MDLGGKHLPSPRFGTSLVGGYEKAEVDDYVENAEQLVAELRTGIGALNVELSRNRSDSKAMDRRTLVTRNLERVYHQSGHNTFRLALDRLAPEAQGWVISLLATPLASTILAKLPRASRAAILSQLAVPALVAQKQLLEAAEGFMTLITGAADGSEAVGDIGLAATLIQGLGAEMSPTLAALAPEIATQIEASLVRPADILQLDGRDLQRLLRNCAMDDLVCFLSNQPKRILDHICTGLSARAADRLRADLEILGRVHPERRLGAETAILNAVRELGTA